MFHNFLVKVLLVFIHWEWGRLVHKIISHLTWELVYMLFHVLQHIGISICDDKSVLEDGDYGPNVEILRAEELRLIRRAVWFRYACPLQEFPSDYSRIPHGRLVDCHHIISKAVRNDESSPLVLWFYRILIYK